MAFRGADGVSYTNSMQNRVHCPLIASIVWYCRRTCAALSRREVLAESCVPAAAAQLPEDVAVAACTGIVGAVRAWLDDGGQVDATWGGPGCVHWTSCGRERP